jgi:hypothetical protein
MGVRLSLDVPVPVDERDEAVPGCVIAATAAPATDRAMRMGISLSGIKFKSPKPSISCDIGGLTPALIHGRRP